MTPILLCIIVVFLFIDLHSISKSLESINDTLNESKMLSSKIESHLKDILFHVEI